MVNRVLRRLAHPSNSSFLPCLLCVLCLCVVRTATGAVLAPVKIWLPTNIVSKQPPGGLHPRLLVKGSYSFEQKLPLMEQLGELLDRHADWQFELEFIPWVSSLGRFEQAKANPAEAPDITWIPSTWEASFRPYLEKLNQRGIDNQAKCLDERDRAVALGCDVRLILLWPSLIPDAEDGLKDRMLNDRSAVSLPLSGEYSFEKVALALGQKSQAQRRPFAVPSNADYDVLHTFAVLLWAHGGDILKRPGWFRWPGWFADDAALDSDEAKKTVTFLSKLHQLDALEVKVESTHELQKRFVNQEVGMIVSNPFLFPRFCEDASSMRLAGCSERQDLRIFLPPPAPGCEQSYAFVGGSYLALWRRVRPAERKAELALVLKELLATLQGAGVRSDPREYLRSIELHINNDEFEKELGPNSPNTKVLQMALSRPTARQYPAVPEWVDRVENPETIGLFSRLWNELANEDTAQRELAYINNRISNQGRTIELRTSLAKLTLYVSALAIFVAALASALFVTRKRLVRDRQRAMEEDRLDARLAIARLKEIKEREALSSRGS